MLIWLSSKLLYKLDLFAVEMVLVVIVDKLKRPDCTWVFDKYNVFYCFVHVRRMLNIHNGKLNRNPYVFDSFDICHEFPKDIDWN